MDDFELIERISKRTSELTAHELLDGPLDNIQEDISKIKISIEALGVSFASCASRTEVSEAIVECSRVRTAARYRLLGAFLGVGGLIATIIALVL